MAGMVILGTLAAFGGFCMLYALLGWLLPPARGCVMVCAGTPDEGIVSRWRWLRGMGLLRVPLVCAANDEYTRYCDVEICSPEALLSRLEQERIYGTGDGDPARRSQRRGISEL